jgi:N-acetyl-alpha-D-glucosaminyl L-malate synthase BshA
MVGDGPDLHDAVCLARSLGIADDVEFLGEQDQVVPILSVADVFLLPSSQESFGLAALEAMACEVPVVASRVGGLPELVEHGVSGFLHPLGDLDEMARSATRLLTDEALHLRAADASRRLAQDKYCDSKIVPAYEAYYLEIVNG